MNFFTDPLGVIGTFLAGLLTGLGLPEPATRIVLMALGVAVLGTLGLILPLFTIWLERRLIARMQDRMGPNRVGPNGLLQSIADAIKLLIKEDITPAGADKVAYNLAPILAVVSIVTMWAVLPFASTVYGVDLNVGVLYIVAVGSLGTLAIMMAGWSSNNKYALLGAFRTVAQLVSYEVPMILSLIVPVVLASAMGAAHPMSLNEIVKAQHVWFLVSAPIAALIFFITSVAEVGRAPFDLLEAESEIVAGFHIEYTGMKFGMFFVAEFTHAFTIGAFTAVFFLGGWRGPWAEQVPLLGVLYFLLKSFAAYFIVILLRGSMPRIRIDHLLDLNWKVLTPLALGALVVTMVVGKIVQGQSPWLQAGVLLLANVLLAWAAIQIVAGSARRLRAREERLPGGPAAGHAPGHEAPDSGHAEHGHAAAPQPAH